VTGTPAQLEVAAVVRTQIADGTLKPGDIAPSGAALSRATGHAKVTCRKALQLLVEEGILTPRCSASGRPRVAGGGQNSQDASHSAGALSAALARWRRAAGLTQPELATLIGMSVTAVGHAETRRLWQSRDFWERADKALGAGGELLHLHAAHLAVGPVDPEPPGLLTKAEREAVRQAGLLYTFIAEQVVVDGPTRNDDLAEVRAAVHVVQRAVLAQAAARGYPAEFRLLGGVLPSAVPCNRRAVAEAVEEDRDG
jgi:transcriptional regulator with XRE-family HTH domain